MATVDETTPRHFGANKLNFLMESRFGSSRETIKAELVNKITYDDPNVFRRLRIVDIPHDLVEKCAASLDTENAEDIALLKGVAATASNKLPDDLEEEEEANNDVAQSGNNGTEEERKMYAPIVRLFNHIAEFGGTPGLRQVEHTKSMLKADEPHTFGFSSVSPDITISQRGVNASTSKKWRHRDAFGEVKPSDKQGPKPLLPGTVQPIVTQCADYAQLFMSARPFMLFCTGVLIFGTKFCVGIFDRDGVTFSPIFDMFDDIKTLICVVRSLTCQLSIQELGFDPTVRVLDDQETMELTGQRDTYPSAVVRCAHRDWCTIGFPNWISLSILGRGTNVWHVREYVLDNDQHPCLQGDLMIMKTAWRSSARTPESDIYRSIDNPYPAGLAKFECGSDVEFPSSRFPVTVLNLRGKAKLPNDSSTSPVTPVLHRLVLRTVGRPMWEYKSEMDLLTGFRDAVQAHMELYDKGILHRDISPGNVLLTEIPNGGFITDVEFAHIQKSTMQNFESTVTINRGTGVSANGIAQGTAQFMARAILEANDANLPIVHEAAHDVESFIWVLSYSVMRNLLIRASEEPSKEFQDSCNSLREIYQEAFCKAANMKIATQRQSRSAALAFPGRHKVHKIIESFMSNILVSLFKEFQALIHRSADIFNPVPLTHHDLLSVVNKAIASLQ
ncbi:hypothetical protein CVT25_012036 [Psilocybe cyanescens]|uniref:Fungal-type protein kinase domain-containing protein n=1 Tax=Psilocybe cyanescens TaxID=93625 RepID=A0A409VWC7_PSICY|nr:hypothetical protein CVT25_012036 [Psilocybe cyanescens]